MHDFRVGALLEALRTGEVLYATDDSWLDLSRSEARAIAEEVYARTGAWDTGCWKLGALDRATQRRFGIDAPLVAPCLPGRLTLHAGNERLRVADYIQPRFEAEVGIMDRGGVLLAVPCVEIADCRFSDWNLPPYGVIVDYCLQGGMLFGPPSGSPGERISIEIRHDGHRLHRSEASWSEVSSRMDLLSSSGARSFVATGAASPLLSVEPGTWEFVFGGVGELTVTVS